MQSARGDRRDFSIEIPRCPAGDGPSVPLVDGYLLSVAPVGEYVDASQLTEAAICYNDAGFEVVFRAVERNTFSTAAECMAPVWEHGCAMELFVAPVRDRWDVPSEYQEIDGAPSGAVWGSCINTTGVCPGCANATESTCAVPGAYECFGEELGRFTNGVVGEAKQTGNGWQLRLSLPWSIFAEWARPTSPGAGAISPWAHWRLNLYRYNFFHHGAAPVGYELDAWSPTHLPTFHDPRHFGYAKLISAEPDRGFMLELLLLCAETVAALLLVVVLIRVLFGAGDSRSEQPRHSNKTNLSMHPSEAETEAAVLLPVSRASSNSELTTLAGTPGVQDKKHRWLAPRHTVVVLTLLANMVCYADRTNISVAIVAMSAQYGWSEVQQGAILGAFFWGYILTQVLGGWASARWGGKAVLMWGVCLWSFFTLLTPLSASLGLGSLVCCRVLMGLGEGVTMPATHSLLGIWLRPEERTRAVAATTSGQTFGTVIAMASSPLAASSWQTVFYFFGALGYVYAAVLATAIPSVKHRQSHNDDQCQNQQGTASPTTATPVSALKHICAEVCFLLRQKPMVAVVAAHVAHGYGWYVAQSWLPQYFNQVLHVELQDVGLYAVLPYITSVVIGNGWAAAIEHFIVTKPAFTPLAARKLSQVVAFVSPSVCIAVLLSLGDAVTPLVAAALFSAALGMNMASHSGYWANIIELSPQRAGFVLGVSNTIGNIPGIYGNLLTGWVLSATGGSWVIVFSVAILHWVAGAVVYTGWASTDEIF